MRLFLLEDAPLVFFHVFEDDIRAFVGTQQFELHILQVETIDVAGKETVGRRRPCPAGFGIVGTLFAIGRCYLLPDFVDASPKMAHEFFYVEKRLDHLLLFGQE